MKTPHVHAELIKAWADGAEIQWYDSHPRQHRWFDCGPNQPSWNEGVQFRIKPEPKPDYVYYASFRNAKGQRVLESYITSWRNDATDSLKLIFDAETGKLKSAEMLSKKNNT